VGTPQEAWTGGWLGAKSIGSAKGRNGAGGREGELEARKPSAPRDASWKTVKRGGKKGRRGGQRTEPEGGLSKESRTGRPKRPDAGRSYASKEIQNRRFQRKGRLPPWGVVERRRRVECSQGGGHPRATRGLVRKVRWKDTKKRGKEALRERSLIHKVTGRKAEKKTRLSQILRATRKGSSAYKKGRRHRPEWLHLPEWCT